MMCRSRTLVFCLCGIRHHVPPTPATYPGQAAAIPTKPEAPQHQGRGRIPLGKVAPGPLLQKLQLGPHHRPINRPSQADVEGQVARPTSTRHSPAEELITTTTAAASSADNMHNNAIHELYRIHIEDGEESDGEEDDDGRKWDDMGELDRGREKAQANRIAARIPLGGGDHLDGFGDDTNDCAVDHPHSYDLDPEKIVGLSEAPNVWHPPGEPPDFDPNKHVWRFKDAPDFPTDYEHNPANWPLFVFRPKLDGRAHS